MVYIKAYQIKVELMESSPVIWRRVVFPADITFYRLHDVIQFVMGWQDCHLYEFIISPEKLRIVGDEEEYREHRYNLQEYKGKDLSNNPIMARMLGTKVRWAPRVKVDKYLNTYGVLQYIYDYGDYWQHKLTLESVVDDYEHRYPICLDGKGACPPEDVGGIDGYHHFLQAWNDPKHDEHEEYREWGESMSFQQFDIKSVNETMKYCLVLKRARTEK